MGIATYNCILLDLRKLVSVTLKQIARDVSPLHWPHTLWARVLKAF